MVHAYVKAHLLNNIGDVDPSEGQVLKSIIKIAEFSQIMDRSTDFTRDFSAWYGVDKYELRITINHVNQNVEHVLRWRNKEATKITLNLHS